MPLIQVPRSARPRQIDDFDADVERSKPGALYFTPGSTKRVTKDELEFIEENHKDFFKILVVLPFDETKGKLARKKALESRPSKPKKLRPKDRMSKAKQRAKALVEAAKRPPAPNVAPPPDDSGGKSDKKKKK